MFEIATVNRPNVLSIFIYKMDIKGNVPYNKYYKSVAKTYFKTK